MPIFTDAQYDEDILVAIEDSESTFTYTKNTTSATDFNPETGEIASSSESQEIAGIKEKLTLEQVESSSGKFQIGDKRFFFRQADYTLASPPDTLDTVTEHTVVYRVEFVALDATERLWIIIGRKV